MPHLPAPVAVGRSARLERSVLALGVVGFVLGVACFALDVAEPLARRLRLQAPRMDDDPALAVSLDPLAPLRDDLAALLEAGGSIVVYCELDDASMRPASVATVSEGGIATTARGEDPIVAAGEALERWRAAAEGGRHGATD